LLLLVRLQLRRHLHRLLLRLLLRKKRTPFENVYENAPDADSVISNSTKSSMTLPRR
ncbi:hypothetical protein CTA1_8446, partial [Colletotrichum tanaceti]